MVKLTKVVAAIAADVPDPAIADRVARAALEAAGLYVASDGEVFDPAVGLTRAPMRTKTWQQPEQQRVRHYGMRSRARR